MPYSDMKLLYKIVNSTLDNVCCFYQAYLQSNFEHLINTTTIYFVFSNHSVWFYHTHCQVSSKLMRDMVGNWEIVSWGGVFTYKNSPEEIKRLHNISTGNLGTNSTLQWRDNRVITRHKTRGKQRCVLMWHFHSEYAQPLEHKFLK